MEVPDMLLPDVGDQPRRHVSEVIQGDILYPHPPSPLVGHKAILGGQGGGGVYFEAPSTEI